MDALPAWIRQFPATDGFVLAVVAAFLCRRALALTAGEAAARATFRADPAHPGRLRTWVLAPVAHDSLSGVGLAVGVGYVVWRYAEYFLGSRGAVGAFLASGVSAVACALAAGDAATGSGPGLVGLVGALAAARPREGFPLPLVPLRLQPPGWLVLAAGVGVGAVARGVGPPGVVRPTHLVGLLVGAASGRVLVRTGRVR